MVVKRNDPLGEVSERSLASEKTSILMLLPHKPDKVTHLWRVHPEDFDAEKLLAAAREGRLYVDMTDEETAVEQLLKQRKREALDYVNSIDKYVVPEWQPHIKMLWTMLLDDPLFTPLLVLQKGKHQGLLNRYLVTNIVFHLQVLNVYQCNSLIELHKKLEGVNEKNSIYKSAGLYSLSSTQRQRLRQLKESLFASLK